MLSEFQNGMKLLDWQYFMLDNDYGEHWFDNWDKREEIQEKAKEMGYYSDDLLIVDPSRLQNEKDGPCHTDEERKMFWTDVYKSLHISLETIFAESRKIYKKTSEDNSLSLSDLEYKIEQLSSKLKNHEQISRP